MKRSQGSTPSKIENQRSYRHLPIEGLRVLTIWNRQTRSHLDHRSPKSHDLLLHYRQAEKVPFSNSWPYAYQILLQLEHAGLRYGPSLLRDMQSVVAYTQEPQPAEGAGK